jgi:alpha-L-rhamnosidase
MKKWMLYLLLLIGFSTTAQPIIKTNWKANWIGENFSSVPNTFYKHRYQFQLEEQPAVAIASISCDSKYWLYINGQLVVFEGQLKRGPTPNDTYYDEVNIQPYLQQGKNTIAILMWYWGKQGFGHNSSGRAGLLFEAEMDKQFITSNSNWKLEKHVSYRNSTGQQPNFRLPEFNIHYDARYDNEEWLKPSFNDSGWTNASLIANAGEAPWNQLWKRPLPLWKNSGLITYENKTVNNENGKIIMQLPLNLTVTPYFKIEAPAGLLIDIRTDNYLGGSDPNVRTEYITKAGVQEFETPAYMNGQQVIYSFPKEVKVLELKYRETKYNTSYVGSFSSNDVFLNKLWQMSTTTLNVNMRDGIYDCPDRERAQWWGDIVINLEEIFYSCDSNGVPAIKKAISNLLEWQKKDGALFSPIPAGNWDKELPAQMLAAIGKYGIWKYIEHSGDTAMIRYAYPFVKKYMRLWSLNEKGLVNHRTGGWDWHDWGSKIDMPLLDNAWYYMALESCYNMAKHLNLAADAANYEQQMQSIKTNFQKYFWKENRFASDEYKFYADDRGNGLAVCAGLVSKEQWKQLKPVLDTTFHAGPYLEKYILESYFIMNDASDGIKRMKHRYDKMVNHPTITTLWEGWEIGSSTYGGGTYNHGWSGGPLSLMSAYVAGVRPLANGYASYIIQPQLGNLQTVQSRTFTAKGFTGVELYAKDGSLKMNIETVDAKGLIAVPKLSSKAKIRSISNKRMMKYKKQDAVYWYYECNQKGRVMIVVSY